VTGDRCRRDDDQRLVTNACSGVLHGGIHGAPPCRG
jgi:hypothetical protein